MSVRALMILADGFEEVEALTVVDILRRGQIKVTLAALDFKLVDGAHDIMVKADCLLEALPDYTYEMLILPGGAKGTDNLQNSEEVANLIKRFDVEGKWIAAICAAPRILDHMGLLKGKHATSFPGAKPDMKDCNWVDQDVVVDGNCITSKGPATAFAFGFQLLDVLKPEHVKEVQDAMLYIG